MALGLFLAVGFPAGALATRGDIVGRRGDWRCALFLLGAGILGTLGQEAVARLREDPGLRERLGRSGRQAYEEMYSWARMEACLVRLNEDPVR